MQTQLQPSRLDPCPRCGTPQEVINGFWLRAKRIKAGVGLRELARELGISACYLSDMERNRRTCPPRIAKRYDRF